MRKVLVLLLILLLFSVMAQTPQSLRKDLNLGSLRELTIVASEGGATSASYQLFSAEGAPPVVDAVQAKLKAEGWEARPNAKGSKPKIRNTFASNLRGERLLTFAKGNDVLEMRVSPVARSNFVSLVLVLDR